MSKKDINTTSALSVEVKNKSGETALRTEPNQLLSDSVTDIWQKVIKWLSLLTSSFLCFVEIVQQYREQNTEAKNKAKIQCIANRCWNTHNPSPCTVLFMIASQTSPFFSKSLVTIRISFFIYWNFAVDLKSLARRIWRRRDRGYFFRTCVVQETSLKGL